MKRAIAIGVAVLLAAAAAWRLRRDGPPEVEAGRAPEAPKPAAPADPFAAELPAGKEGAVPPPPPTPADDVRIPSYPPGDTERPKVAPGLAWLLRTQNPDGSWGFGSEDVEGAVWSKQGATALALLAFFEAAYSHVSKDEFDGGTVGEAIKRGLKWMVANPPQGAFESAVAALAWGEGYGLTNSAILKQYAVKEYETLLGYQGADGAWNADPATTAWAAMAVRSARLAGLELPEGPAERLRGWYEARLAAGGTPADGAGWLCVPGAKDAPGWDLAKAAAGTRPPSLDGELTAGLQAAWIVPLLHPPESEGWEAWKKSVYDAIPSHAAEPPPAGTVQGTGAVVRHAMRQLMIESFFLSTSPSTHKRQK